MHPMSFTPSLSVCLVWSEEAQMCPAIHAMSQKSYSALPITALQSTHYIFIHRSIFGCSDESPCHSLCHEPAPRTDHLEARSSKLKYGISTRPSRHMQHTVKYLLNPQRWALFGALCQLSRVMFWHLFSRLSFFFLGLSHVVRWWWLLYGFIFFLRL